MYFNSPVSTFFQLLVSASFAFAQYSGGDYGSRCVTGVHMIVARGSIEPPGPGILESVVYDVMGQVPDSDYDPVPYPATLSKYKFSETYGVGNMTRLLKDYSQRCPNSKIALLGYSQGAQIIGNMLCGNSEEGWNQTKPLGLKWAKNVVAIIQWGDPTFRPHLRWDVGTNTKHHGLFPRRDLKSCQHYADVVQSYCDKNDIACASGKSVEVHTSYANIYTTQSANFIARRYYNPKKLKARPLQLKPNKSKCKDHKCKNHKHKHKQHDRGHHGQHHTRGSGSHANHGGSGQSSGPGALSPSKHGKGHDAGQDPDCADGCPGQPHHRTNAAERSFGTTSIAASLLTILTMAITL